MPRSCAVSTLQGESARTRLILDAQVASSKEGRGGSAAIGLFGLLSFINDPPMECQGGGGGGCRVGTNVPCKHLNKVHCAVIFILTILLYDDNPRLLFVRSVV